MLNSVIAYFDLQSAARGLAHGQSGGPGAVRIPVTLQYLATASGIIADPYLTQYMATGSFGVTWEALGARVVFGLLIGIVLLPAVYRASFDPDKPTPVQLAALFVSGVGWQSLFSAAAKATSSS